MFISRSVIFDEIKFPFADKLQKPVQTVSHSTVGLPCIPLVKNLEPLSVSPSLSLPTSSAQSKSST